MLTIKKIIECYEPFEQTHNYYMNKFLQKKLH